MKTLYIECNMGAAGDMLMSALSELLPDQNTFIRKMNTLNIPDVRFKKKKTTKCGIVGTHINVIIDGQSENEHMHDHHDHHDHHEHHDHHHTNINDVKHIVDRLELPENVRSDVLSVYKLIAEAESAAHDCDIDNIHFHEVGTMDAIADIVGVCLLMNEIAPERVIVSPVCVGYGEVRCAHGILPVPAPATAHILKNIPIYGGDTKGELCTPTGAALIKRFADEFGDMPVMSVSKIGYGMGTKNFKAANCLRVMLGETSIEPIPTDKICELSCNIDDMTGEEIGYAADMLMQSGALDVFTVPIGMKKSRPGTLMTCLCKPEYKEKLVRLIFKHTSTIGVRESLSSRYILSRRTETIHSEYGNIRVKISEGGGTAKHKYEYEDIAKAARDSDLSLAEIKKNLDTQLNQ